MTGEATVDERSTNGNLAPEERHEKGAEALTTEQVEANLRTLLGGADDNPNPSGEESQPGAGQEGNGAGNEGDGEGAEHEESAEARAEWPDSAQRRVDKLTAQKAELRDKATTLQSEKDALAQQVTELNGRVKELEGGAGSAVPTPGNPLGFLKTPKELSDYVTAVKGQLRNVEDYLDDSLDEGQLERFREWAKANGAFDAESGEFNTQKLKQLKRLANDALNEHVPARLQYMRQEAEQSAIAEEQFPWLKDQKSEEYKVFQDVVKTLPELRRLPHWKGVVAIFVKGLQTVKAEVGGKGKGKAPAGKPQSRLPGAATVLPQRTSGNGGAAIDALRDKANKSKNPKDYEALIKAQLETA
jgi:hypothetical protein